MKNLFLVFFVTILLVSCKPKPPYKDERFPLNITILVDASERIKVENQISKDTAIIMHIADIFKKNTLGPDILKSKNHLQVVFLPYPKDKHVINLTSELNIDMSSLPQNVERRKKLEKMDSLFRENITDIYQRKIAQHKNTKWNGSDIWDFFNGEVQKYIADSARNIIFILTDGYLEAEKNVNKKVGHRYTYLNHNVISSENLRQYVTYDSIKSVIQKKDFGLLKTKNSLKNSELVFLELDPLPQYKQQDKDIMEIVLEEWAINMNVENVSCYTTDQPTTTSKIIDKILK